MYIHKVGTALQSAAVPTANPDVRVGLAKSGLAVDVCRVTEELSTPLTRVELTQLYLLSFHGPD
jgi:hypothetical protein